MVVFKEGCLLGGDEVLYKRLEVKVNDFGEDFVDCIIN